MSWNYPKAGTGTINSITSTGGTLTITTPGGPTTNAEIKPDAGTEWVAPTLLNSWVTPWSAGYSTVAYMKDRLGFVHLKGTVKSGTLNSIVFVLPAGFRPGTHFLQLLLVTSTGGTGTIDIDSAGNVFLTTGSSTVLSLDGFSFLAEA